MGSIKSDFFARISFVWTPPKPFQSLVVNTKPTEDDLTPSTPSHKSPPVLHETLDNGMPTSLVPTTSVSCYTGNFKDQKFAALLKGNEVNEMLVQTLADICFKIGSRKALFYRLKRAFDKKNY